MGFTYDVFDSGLFSSAMFLIAMLIYDSANLYEIGVLRPDAPDRAKNDGWISFWGAIAFVLESLSDIVWFIGESWCSKEGKKKSVSKSSINDPLYSKERDVLQSMATLRSYSKERDVLQSIATLRSVRSLRDEKVSSHGSSAALLLDDGPVIRTVRKTFGKRRTCTTIINTTKNRKDIPSFYLIRWNLWSAVFFLIASLFFLAQSLIDQYTMYCPALVKLLEEWRVSNDEYYNITNDCASWLFTFDSLINIMAWWSLIRIQGEWTCADWMLWADILFVFASIFEVYNIYDARKEVGIISNVFWTINAFVYVIGSSLALQETRKQAKENDLAASFL